MAADEWAPPGLDATKPNVARGYDYFLGGKNNFSVDREAVEQVVKVMPPGWDSTRCARENRTFLGRVVRYLVAEAGIRQLLDIGSGLPTQENVHQIAQATDPLTRVVYVDNDPVVLVHARALLGTTETTKVITADLRRPDEILANSTVQKFFDFDRPIGILLFAILHHIKDSEDPVDITARLRSALPPGSYLAISHFQNPGSAHPKDARRAVVAEKAFTENWGTGRWRTYEEILSYFGDLEVIEPGLVPLPEWRPDPGDSSEEHMWYHLLVGGVARKER